MTAVLSYTDRQVLSLLVDPIRGELGISDTQISLLLGTAFAVIYGIAGIPLGYLADRSSRRNLIFAGVSVWSVGTIACGSVAHFAELFASRVVVGLGEAALSPAAISLISDYFSAVPPGHGGRSLPERHRHGNRRGHSDRRQRSTGHQIGCAARYAARHAGTLAQCFAGHRSSRIVVGARDSADSRAGLSRLGVGPRGPRPSRITPPGRTTPWRESYRFILVLAAASFADNAVGAWSPTLLIRNFGRDPAQVGVQLGLLLTLGFGGGVFIGGVLADRAGAGGGWRAKLRVCVYSSFLILPAAMLMTSVAVPPGGSPGTRIFRLVGDRHRRWLFRDPGCGAQSLRGLAMSMSFFLNVAIGAGVGPTAVALAGEHVFGTRQGLGPPLVMTVVGGYLVALVALWTGPVGIATYDRFIASLRSRGGPREVSRLGAAVPGVAR